MPEFVMVPQVLNRLPLLVAALCLLGPARIASAATNPPPVSMEQIARATEGVETVFTRFVQERHLSLFDEPLRSEGYLACQKPGRLRWQTTEPYPSILISDGSKVAQFEWMDEQWRPLDMGLAQAMKRVTAQIASVVEGGYAQDQGAFTSSLTNTSAGPVIRLVPKNETMRQVLVEVEVHLQADLRGTRRVVLRERGGDHTDILFEDQVCNVRFPSGTFDCANPAAIEQVLAAAREGTP